VCRVASITLADDPRSPGRARAWTESRLDSWEIDDEGVTTLLVSELVTNAVKHARATSTLTLAVAAGMIEVSVTDGGSPRLVIPAQSDMTARGSTRVISESGRGLMIVEALADTWGVTPAGRRKQVWFRRPIAADWPYSARCACRADDQTAYHLPSGHRALDMRGPWDHRSR
jgi:anti-sigma regulatory factor (Ser/Thr protein kinase)